MRQKTLLMMVCVLLLTTVAAIAVAQDDPPTETPLSELELQDLVDRAERAAIRAEDSADEADIAVARADAALGHANDLFGLFEAMSGAVGLVIPFLAVVAGVLGFRRLENANAELREAKEKFEQELAERNRQLDRLSHELEETVRQQREETAKASLAMALLQLGERQYKAQDYQGALDTYHRALALDDRNPITHYRMGYVYVHSDRFEKAEEHLSRSLDLDANFMPAVATRGYVYRRMGDRMDPGLEQDTMYNNAEQNFLKALTVYPKLIDEDGESWWGSLGGLYRRRGQIDQAIHAYEQCAAAVPRSSYAFSNLALLYGQKHNVDKMTETYAQVEKLAWGEIQADVDNYWAYADLVTARIAQGKVKETWDVLDTALATAPADSPYTLTILLDTLSRLKGAMGSEAHERIDKVIDHIKVVQKKRYGSDDDDDTKDDDSTESETETDSSTE